MCRAPIKGFTLVELAIVMTIIGILIGGLLKGEEFVNHARVTRQIKDVREITAAAFTFRDKYSTLPGDLSTATSRIEDCVAAIYCAAGDGDSVVGQKFVAEDYAYYYNPIMLDENTQFWRHLALTQMISGLRQSGEIGWGDSHPASPFRGGLQVWYSRNSFDGSVIGQALTLRTEMNGQNLYSYWKVPDVHPLRAKYAKMIDVKMDDGRSDGGYVRVWPVDYACGDTNNSLGGNTAPDGSPDGYNERDSRYNCSMQFLLTR